MAVSAYVANSNSNNVSVIDTVGFTVITTITVGTSPRGVAVTPNLQTAYVTNFTSGTVSIIATSTNTVSGSITVGNGPGGICVSADGTKLLVCNFTDGTVSIISTATNTVTGLVTLPLHSATNTQPYAVCISPDSGTGYVATKLNTNANWVEVVNISAATVTTSVSLSGTSTNATTLSSVQGICYHPSGTFVYVTGSLSGSIYVINTTTHAIATTMTDLLGEPRGICVLPNASAGYWNGSAGEVYTFNPSTNAVVTNHTLASSHALTGIAPTSDSTLLFNGDSVTGTTSEVWKTTVSTFTSTSLTTGNNYANGIGLSLYPGPSEQIVMIV